MQFVLGIDEAGRGPLAGPVAVGLVKVHKKFDVLREFPGVADSKKLSEKKREEIFKILEARVRVGDISFKVEFGDATRIDTRGISVVIREAIEHGVHQLAPDTAQVEIFLDGALQAPPEYQQQTIIRGDESVPLISLASIAAKVTRDRFMVKMSEQYPEYGFAQHKGYGTVAHQKAIRMFGLSNLHRRTFCTRFIT